MRRMFRAWVALTSRREDGASLAAFRILVGSCVVYSLVAVALVGIVDAIWVDIAYGGIMKLGPGNWLVRSLGGPSPRVVWTLWGVSLGAAVALVLGWQTRVAAFVVLQTYFALTSLNGSATGGYDLMITNALWLLVLARAGATWSVDRWIATRRVGGHVEVPAWPRYLAILQLVVVYGATGLQKLSAVWTPGGGFSALYWVFQDPTWRRYDMDWTATFYPLTQVMTATVWLWEVTAPLLLLVYWFRETRARPGRVRRWVNRWDLRKAFAVLGASMHAGILLTLNVGPFSLISLSYYVCLFTPSELRAALSRWAARSARRAPRSLRPAA